MGSVDVQTESTQLDVICLADSPVVTVPQDLWIGNSGSCRLRTCGEVHGELGKANGNVNSLVALRKVVHSR